MNASDKKDRSIILPVKLETVEQILDEGYVGKRLKELKEDDSIVQIIESEFDVLQQLLKSNMVLIKKYNLNFSYTKSSFTDAIWSKFKIGLLCEGIELSVSFDFSIIKTIEFILDTSDIHLIISNITKHFIDSIEFQIIEKKLSSSPYMVVSTRFLQ